MQQREQLILKKLAEAREAQARAMTRFIQARARVMEVEARLQILRSRFNPSPILPAQAGQSTSRDLSEEETLLISLADIAAASPPDQATPQPQFDPQSGEEVAPTADTGATDITTKIPVIRQERRNSQETP